MLKEIPDPIKLSNLKRSEFKCLNCWELYMQNGQNNMGLKMLEKYLQVFSSPYPISLSLSLKHFCFMIQGSSPRPRFGIVVLGNEIPGWFTHKSKESSIKVQMPSNYPDGDDNGWMGFAACVAFSAHGKSPLFCHFKVDGKENYPSYMYIGCNSMQALSNHLWLFYLSFDYLKELKEWENEAYSELELSFHSYKRGVKVKNCGVRLVNSPYTSSWESPTSHLIVASKEATSSYIDALANSSSYYQWMHDVFFSFSGEHISNNFTHLYTAIVRRGIIRGDTELEYLRVIESSLLRDIKEWGYQLLYLQEIMLVQLVGLSNFSRLLDS